ncbi:unnamed protein product [Effrenium voratum]|uniref:Phospholipase/carboxylesterase/thioesterase domain-containing protein n=1 Tax=Effrenium voratum TaxID=2562239 RepID=A0AA36I902_9DINO|nr:unnamed protein product [Effrenium voratum]
MLVDASRGKVGSWDNRSLQELSQLQRVVCNHWAFREIQALQRAENELLAAAKASGVRLKPPKWLLPPGLQDFDYIHTIREGSASQPADAEGLSPGAGLERNLLIVLHGFGGNKAAFTTFARKLQLPQTAVLVLNGPQALPDELLDHPPGFSWFDMLDEETGDFIQPSREEPRRVRSLEASVALLWQMVHVLISYGSWTLNELLLFGFGQGGTVALDMVLGSPQALPGQSLAAVIAVASEVMPERLLAKKPVAGQDAAVLLINGARDRSISVKAAEASAQYLRQARGNVQLRVFKDRAGEMLRGHHAEESRCFMEFLSDNLHGVGRKGSEEAMRKLGAEPVVGPVPNPLVLSLNEMD